MTQPEFKHSILERLDASIQQFEEAINDLPETKTTGDSTMRKNKFILMQTRREIISVREEAVATLTRLNTFGATLDIMGHPDAGVDAAVENVLQWFLLLTLCDRAFISLYDEAQDKFYLHAKHEWNAEELRTEERDISTTVLEEVQQSKEVFSSSNMDMASASYQKGGSWRIPLRTVFGIPLLWNNQLIGIFYGDRKITSGALAQDMIPLVKLYAAQAAIAIHNAQLFAQFSQVDE